MLRECLTLLEAQGWNLTCKFVSIIQSGIKLCLSKVQKFAQQSPLQMWMILVLLSTTYIFNSKKGLKILSDLQATT